MLSTDGNMKLIFFSDKHYYMLPSPNTLYTHIHMHNTCMSHAHHVHTPARQPVENPQETDIEESIVILQVQTNGRSLLKHTLKLVALYMYMLELAGSY